MRGNECNVSLYCSNFKIQFLKRFFSIVLIIIVLLNTMGYYVIFVGLQYKHDAAIIKKLDTDHYDAFQTVTLKLPISVPYRIDDENFTRVNGVIEHNGEHYRLVKQKYANDTLTVICIRDVERKKINEDMADYVKGFTDKASGRHNNVKQTITFIKDFLPHFLAVASATNGWESDIQHITFPEPLVSSFEPSVIHPPENRA